MYSDEDLLLISGLQHLSFCERRWAIIHMDQEWAENVLTIEGKQLHQRVHEQGAESRGQVRLVRGLQLHSFALGLFGVADLVEFHNTPEGLKPYPVEYKRGGKRYERSDEIQLCAQAMCLEEMLGASVAEGAIFYGQPRKRHQVDFDGLLRENVGFLCKRARELLEKKRIPPAIIAPHCGNCSLNSVCMPELSGKDRSKRYLEEIITCIEDNVT